MSDPKTPSQGRRRAPPALGANRPGEGTTIYTPEFVEPVVRSEDGGANRTIVPAEDDGIPRAGEVGVAYVVDLRAMREAAAPVLSRSPPEIVPARRRVELVVREEIIISHEEADAYPWVPSPRPLGKPVAVDGKMVAVYAAAKIHSFSFDNGVWTVVIDLVFAYIDDEETRRAWQTKYRQEEEARRKALIAALSSVFERAKLAPGLVVRFVGGPPMSQADAAANGYHFWVNARSPTRVEISDGQVVAAQARAISVYTEGTRSLYQWKVHWWKWFATQDRRPFDLVVGWWVAGIKKAGALARQFDLGKLLKEGSAETTLDIGVREMEALLTATAGLAGPVISSLGAVIYGDDLRAAEALKGKGRVAVSPTEIGTYLTYHAEE